MADIKQWTTVFPGDLDTLSNMPDVANTSDLTVAEQINSLRDAVHSLETLVGSYNLELGSLRAGSDFNEEFASGSIDPETGRWTKFSTGGGTQTVSSNTLSLTQPATTPGLVTGITRLLFKPYRVEFWCHVTNLAGINDTAGTLVILAAGSTNFVNIGVVQNNAGLQQVFMDSTFHSVVGTTIGQNSAWVKLVSDVGVIQGYYSTNAANDEPEEGEWTLLTRFEFNQAWMRLEDMQCSVVSDAGATLSAEFRHLKVRYY